MLAARQGVERRHGPLPALRGHDRHVDAVVRPSPASVMNVGAPFRSANPASIQLVRTDISWP